MGRRGIQVLAGVVPVLQEARPAVHLLGNTDDKAMGLGGRLVGVGNGGARTEVSFCRGVRCGLPYHRPLKPEPHGNVEHAAR